MKTVEVAQAIQHYLGAQWRRRYFDPARLHAFQDERARRMVAFAHAQSPFYNAHWAGCALDRWRELPPVDKVKMMANFDSFNTRGVSGAQAMAVALQAERSRDFRPQIGDLTVGLSSGTSGHRGLFLVSPCEQAAWAGVILARALHQIRLWRRRVAFFLRSHSNLYAQASGLLIDLRYFDLMTPIAEAVAALNRCQPSILVGPPSLLAMLADAAEEGSLRIAPERLISVAEVLEPQEQVRLLRSFQAPVHQIYQCTEGLLAVSCPEGRLHLQEDIVVVEEEALPNEPKIYPRTVASSGALSPARRIAPIVTDLWRKTQPIIRYQLNDVLQMDDRVCPCGSCFRVIAAVEGRRDDVVYFIGAGGVRQAFFPDTIRRMVLLSDPHIVDYAAVQEADGELRIHLAVRASSDFAAVAGDVQRNVASTLALYGCTANLIAIENGLPPSPPSAKRRRVRRMQ